MVSGFDSPVCTAVDRSFVYPESLYPEVRDWRFADFQESHIGPGWHAMAGAKLLAGIATKERIAEALLRRELWDFFMVVFGESDTVSHHFWRYHDPQSPRFAPRSRDHDSTRLRASRRRRRATGRGRGVLTPSSAWSPTTVSAAPARAWFTSTTGSRNAGTCGLQNRPPPALPSRRWRCVAYQRRGRARCFAGSAGWPRARETQSRFSGHRLGGHARVVGRTQLLPFPSASTCKAANLPAWSLRTSTTRSAATCAATWKPGTPSHGRGAVTSCIPANAVTARPTSSWSSH